MKQKYPKDMLAIHDKELYIRSDCTSVPMLVLLMDGMTQYFFCNNKKEPAYVKAIDVLAWYKKEIKFRPNAELVINSIHNMKRLLYSFEKSVASKKDLVSEIEIVSEEEFAAA